MATLVKFRVHPQTDDSGEDLFAYFPKIDETYIEKGVVNELKMCYSHIGGHSACSPIYEQESRPATPEEYEPLKRELEQIGYVLKVCK